MLVCDATEITIATVSMCKCAKHMWRVLSARPRIDDRAEPITESSAIASRSDAIWWQVKCAGGV